jgi:hypothetical protein
MREVKFASAALGFIIGVLAAGPANAWERGEVHVFANLPDPVEGLAVGPTTLPSTDQGKIYAASNGVTPPNLFVIPTTGCHPDKCNPTATIKGNGVTGNLLGMAFTPGDTPKLLVVDSGSSQVLSVDRATGSTSLFMSLPANSKAMLNAITFDTTSIYVSDSANGIIWTMLLSSAPGVASQWIKDPLLSPSTGGQPALSPNVGANGLAFNADGTKLFVANTAFRNIIQIPVSGRLPGTPEVFATGVNGPDGIARHPTTKNIWIAANMSDEIVVIGSESGEGLAKRGDFKGVMKGPGEGDCPPNCVAHGLLFPTNLAFSNDGNNVYIANPAFVIDKSIVALLASMVTTWTISRMETSFP